VPGKQTVSSRGKQRKGSMRWGLAARSEKQEGPWERCNVGVVCVAVICLLCMRLRYMIVEGV
jgi:hypothetical protein